MLQISLVHAVYTSTCYNYCSNEQTLKSCNQDRRQLLFVVYLREIKELSTYKIILHKTLNNFHFVNSFVCRRGSFEIGTSKYDLLVMYFLHMKAIVQDHLQIKDCGIFKQMFIHILQ